jgi:hypothetical protein
VLLASMVAVLHAAAILFMLTGGLAALRRPWLFLLHAPVSLVILAVNLAGVDCPLTTLESWLRARSGQPLYSGGFLGHYLFQPLGLEVAATGTQIGIYVVALLPNVIAYGALATRGRRRDNRRATYSKECSGPGKVPPRTSSAYSRAARSSSLRRSAYLFTNFGTRPPV